jgi:hypothetical protein
MHTGHSGGDWSLEIGPKYTGNAKVKMGTDVHIFRSNGWVQLKKS